ncbi:MAG: PH domain-containing protein [Thermoplasmata archaeon]|nr:PH domain-containing protein [Thermoplasmata archaeon]
MRLDTIYEEAAFSKAITAIMAGIAALMLGLALFQLIVGPLGSRPAPTLLFVGIAALFGLLAVNFSRLIIRMTPDSVEIGYGIFRRRIRWSDIEGVHVDELSALREGGVGVRVLKVKGKWRIVYSIVGGPRVVLSLRSGRFREVVFSTKNPDQVVELVRRYAGLRAPT